MKKKVVLATNNSKKLNELQAIMQEFGFELIPQSHFNIGTAEEPFDTFIENALAKARFASEKTNLPAIADDSGICVDALNGAPGIFSARFSGENATDEANNIKLLNLLKTKKIEKHIITAPLFSSKSPKTRNLLFVRVNGTEKS